MALASTGFTATTSKNYVVDAAAIYTNVTYAEVGGFTGTLLGATSGGTTVKIELKYRDVEVDGAIKVKAKGNKRLESAKATATADVKEITPGLIAKALNSTVREALTTEAPAGYKVIEGKMGVDDADYLSNVAIVGTISGTTGQVIIIIDNVLATSGLEIKTEDGKDAVIPMEFEAHATADQLIAKKMPFRIIMPTVV